ncbi:hypothetical protein ACFL06_00415 [Patescibacteria group bacterium]
MRDILSYSEEAIEKFHTYLDRAIVIKIGYIALIFILKWLDIYHAPDIVFVAIASMALLSLLIGIWFERFLVKAKTIINVLFISTIFDLFFLTILTYYLGGIEFVYYTFYIILSFIVFPRAQAIVLTFWVIFLFVGLILFRYFHLIPIAPPVFPREQQDFNNFNYITTNVTTVVLTLTFLGYFSYGFYKMMAKRLVLLKQTHKSLEEEKASLEIKVEARKRDIELERKSLEKRVKERKEELEAQNQELEKKAVELEKFQKVAGGREERIAQLEKEIEKKPNKP